MEPSDKINALLPIFNWSWWQVFLFTFVINWLLIHVVIKSFEPLGLGWPLGKGKRTYWRSALYGDIFLPFGLASSIVVLRNFNSGGAWYTSPWWNWLVIISGFFIIFFLDFRAGYTKKQYLMPSKLWHMLAVFPTFFYIGTMTLIPLFISHKPIWAFLLTIASYTAWFITVVMDFKNPPNVSLTH